MHVASFFLSSSFLFRISNFLQRGNRTSYRGETEFPTKGKQNFLQRGNRISYKGETERLYAPLFHACILVGFFFFSFPNFLQRGNRTTSCTFVSCVHSCWFLDFFGSQNNSLRAEFGMILFQRTFGLHSIGFVCFHQRWCFVTLNIHSSAERIDNVLRVMPAGMPVW
jgi:hypothetical protein